MTSSSIGPAAADIQKLIADGKFAVALEELHPLLEQQPEEPEALYMASVCYRYLGQLDRAQRCLDSLKTLSGDRGRVYQEQGYLYLAKQQPQQALAALANASQLNPALISAWQVQAQILQKLGKPAEARQAEAQATRLQGLPKSLLAVMDLRAQGRLLKAEQLCRKFLQANPRHVEGMRLLADIAVQFGELDDARFLLESASEFEPANNQVKIDLVGVLRKRQQFSDSLSLAEKLHKGEPANPQFLSLFAIETMQMGDYETAIQLFDEVLQQLPGDAITLTSRGHALKTFGEQEEAIACYRAAIEANPWHGEAYYSLSNLKTYRFSEQEIADMLALQTRDEIGPNDQVHLNFALGKAFEDQQDYQRSFQYYTQGNHIKRQRSGYSAESMSDELQAQHTFFSKEMLDSCQGGGCQLPDPIFIVGLPRAGSTLLEQVLSSHSQVEGTLELPNIPSLAQKLRRQGRKEDTLPYPDLLAEFSADQLEEMGQQYIDDTRIHRGNAPFFIDKMPNNFRHIGLIRLILPNAKIIDARRHPMACCFSGFKQLFAEGQEFSYDLTDIGRYYNDYVKLMDHWDAVAPGRVLRVYYENVVADLESQVRRILGYCELAFEETCLSYYDTDRAVRTASSEQVRQPIYSSGVEQWTNFHPYLESLELELAPSLENYNPEEPATG